MKKLFGFLSLVLLLVVLQPAGEASATTRIMWGKTELKIGQIGKVTILSDTKLVKLDSNGNLSMVRSLKKGDEYRVYSYKGNHGGLYGVGGSSFVQKNSSKVKYETPSKWKLSLLQIQSNPLNKPFPDGWVAPVLKSGWSQYHSTNLKTLQNELGFENEGRTFGVTGRSEAVHVIGQSPSSEDEVELLFYMWADSAIPESYRIPVVARELFKLYFEEDADRVWNYFNNNDIPEKFTANGRNVTVLYDPNSGGLLLQLGRK